jgi:hypothetical protein
VPEVQKYRNMWNAAGSSLFDKLFKIVTFDTATIQPLQYVSPDCAVDFRAVPANEEY